MPFKNYHNILLIGLDDDPEDLERVEEIVDKQNVVNKRFTTKKEEFLEGASKAMVNICLIDNRLGKETGLDVMKELKKLSEHNYIIVFSEMDGSTKKDFDVLIEYTNNGAHKFLKKGDPDFESKLISYLTEGFAEAQKRISDLEEKAKFARVILAKARETDKLIDKLIN